MFLTPLERIPKVDMEDNEVDDEVVDVVMDMRVDKVADGVTSMVLDMEVEFSFVTESEIGTQ